MSRHARAREGKLSGDQIEHPKTASRHARAREVIAADAVTAIGDVRIIMRYRPGITPADRLTHKGKQMNITTVIDRGSAGRTLELLCKVVA